MRARLLILLLFAIVVLAGACSSDDDGDDAAATSTTAPSTTSSSTTTTEATTTTEPTPEVSRAAGTETPGPDTTDTTSGPARPSSSGAAGFTEPSDDALVEELTAALLDNSNSSLEPTEAEARCIASGMIDNVGLEALARAGLESDTGGFDPNQLSDADLEAFADSFLACIDIEVLFTYQLSSQLPDAISDESVQCLASELNADGFLEDQLREVLLTGSSAAMTSSPEFQQQMLAALSTCLSAEELLQLGST